MSSIKKRPSNGDGNRSSSKTNKKDADASPSQFEVDNVVVDDVGNAEMSVEDGEEQASFVAPIGISRTPELDAYYFTDDSQKEISRLAKADEHAKITIGQYAHVQMTRGTKGFKLSHPDGFLDKHTKTAMQKVKECAEYRWELAKSQLQSEFESHAEGMVVWHGVYEKALDLSESPTEITKDMLSRISKTSLDLVDSCGQVNSTSVFDKTQASLDKRGINRMEMESLTGAVGLDEETFQPVADRLDQIECKQARTIEYARLAIIYKTMVMSALDRIDALREAQDRPTRVSGLLEKIPEEVAYRLNDFVAVNDTTLEAFNEACSWRR